MSDHVQPLYGGHFAINLIGGSEIYEDASTIREVPDNQEVFVGKNDDRSVIIDLLERVSSADLKDAMTEHLEDILSDLANSVIEPDDTVTRNDMVEDHVLVTKITIDKSGEVENPDVKKVNENLFKESEPLKKIDMYVGLVRLAAYETDVLVTFNPPSRSETDESGSFREMLVSLTLKDASIFG